VESNPAFVKDFLGLAGVKLGPYVIRQIVTMGGVAVIYRGEHETLHNAVAVKVLTPDVVVESLRPTLEQLFLREAQILSQLRSDDILRAHHHGRVLCPADSVERPYLVVDWLEGCTFSDELDNRRPKRRAYTLAEVIELLEPIARALACAHESGIVHRDVNPRNVFLEDVGQGRAPRAKLIDFGFAKEVAKAQGLNLQRVAGTLMARSPDYAAPEHYDREEYGELSENTDIYTFALMLVEALTLESPLRGATPEALRWATTNRKDRPTPNNRGARVSPAVEQLFAEALSVDQFERPGSVLDWWDRLKEASRASSVAELSAAAVALAPASAALPPFDAAPLGTALPLPAERDQFAANPPLLAQVVRQPHTFDRAARAAQNRPRRRFVAVLGILVLGTLGAAFATWWLLSPLKCPTGFADCNDKRRDGCETDLKSDALHCGACQTDCTLGQSSSACSNGRCKLTRCNAEHARDCNQSIADGCEVDVRSDAKNCGECAVVCGSQGAKKSGCTAGKCQLTCQSGFGDCDSSAPNGCEVELSSDPKNCGHCGFACSETACLEGLCVPKLLASPVDAYHLSPRQGELYFWNGTGKRIERISPSGQRSTVVEDVQALSGLAIGPELIVWAAGTPAQIFARQRSEDGAPVARIAGPLASETPLSVAGSYVSWAHRTSLPAPTTKSRTNRAKRPAFPLPAERDVFTAPLAHALDKAQIRSAECSQWPAQFIGDDSAQYCCDESGPLTLIDCAGAKCKSRAYPATCPARLALDERSLFFPQDVRILLLDRSSGQLRQLVRRKRRARELAINGTHVYWLEGDQQAEIWRARKTASAAGGAELVVKRQANVSALAVDDQGLYWVAEGPPESTTSAADAALGKGAGRAIYMLPLAERQ